MFAIALFNMSDRFCDTTYTEDFYNLPLCQRYWTAHFYIFVFLPLTAVYYKLHRLDHIFARRMVYLAASIFSFAYLIFQVFILTSKNIAIFLGRINSTLWESIFVGLILFTLSYVLLRLIRHRHDRKTRNSIN